jgi:hypothetical protein
MAVLDAQGTTFTFADDANSPVTVGGIVSYKFADGEASDIDITTLSSTAKEFRQGLQNFGNCSLTVMRDPFDAGQAEMDSAKAAHATRQCVLTLPSGDIATFNAYVKMFDVSGGVDKVVEGTCNMKITGSVVWTN